MSFSVSVALAVWMALNVHATPQSVYAKHSTHRLHNIGRRGLQIESYHPPTKFSTFDASKSETPIMAPNGSPDKGAISFIGSQLNMTNGTLAFFGGFDSDIASNVYLKQSHENVSFVNAIANVAFQGNQPISFGHSFVTTDTIASSTPSIEVQSIIPQVEDALEGKLNEIEPSLAYLARQNGTVSLTHVLQVRNDNGAWYEAFVDAHTGELLQVTDFVSKASYRVLDISKETLDDEETIISHPADVKSSPNGWHSFSGKDTTTTEGNNVVTFRGPTDNVTTQSSDGLTFDYPYNTDEEPATSSNIDASRTNAFYIANSVHDFAYRYGFTEAVFNFQNDNGNLGGEGNDRVEVSIQDSAGTDNADFATPPDGQSGHCRMFIWDQTKPGADGALENDILVHELTHGISNRMTGGGTGRCLQTLESSGMGEGWSDAVAEWTAQTADMKDFVMGQFVTGKPEGIRSHPYSTSPDVNPLRYSDVKSLNEPHAIGEVWANMLHNVFAALVKEHGFSAEARTNPEGTEGNIVYLHLLFDGFTFQPCNPTFTNARDAILQADKTRYDGANQCLIWKVFASRGLGLNADQNYDDDESLPEGC